MLTPGNWIAIAAIIVPVVVALGCWAAAMFMRTGQVLQEIKQIGGTVTSLAAAFDSQEKRIENHAARLAIIENRPHHCSTSEE